MPMLADRDRLRRVLRMRADGMKFKQIAGELGVCVGVAHSLFKKALWQIEGLRFSEWKKQHSIEAKASP